MKIAAFKSLIVLKWLVSAKPLLLMSFLGLQACEPVDQIVVIDVQSNPLSGELLVGGENYQSGSENNAYFELVNLKSTQDTAEIGTYFEQEYAINIVNSDYTLKYYYQSGSEMPTNYGETITELSIASSQSYTVNPGNIEIRPSFLLNDGAFPEATGETAERAAFYLKSEKSDFELFLGYSDLTPEPVRVIPGVYQVIYRYESGEVIPRNTHAVVLNELDLKQNQELEVNVDGISVTAVYYHNGASFPDSLYQQAEISLADESHRDNVVLGTTNISPSRAIPIIPGTYYAVYRHREGESVPRNPEYVFDKPLELVNQNARVEIDVPSVEIGGSFSVNGDATPGSLYDTARISLRLPDDVAENDIPVGNTFEQSYAGLRVIPDTYHAIYDSVERNDVMPFNRGSLLVESLDVTNSGRIDFNIKSVDVASDLTLDGQRFPESLYESAHIHALKAGDSEAVLIHITHAENTPVPLLAGTYDFIYEVKESDTVMPLNNHFVFQSEQDVQTDWVVSHDFNTTRVQFVPRLNGEVPPSSLYQYGNLYVATQHNESIGIGTTREISDVVTLLVGEYAAYYSFREGASSMPVNSYALVDEFEVIAVQPPVIRRRN